MEETIEGELKRYYKVRQVWRKKVEKKEEEI